MLCYTPYILLITHLNLPSKPFTTPIYTPTHTNFQVTPYNIRSSPRAQLFEQFPGFEYRQQCPLIQEQIHTINII